MYDNEGKNAMRRLSNLRGQSRPLLHGYFRDAAACGANKKALSIAGWLRAFLFSSVEGQSLVEFAFVFPILMGLMMGIYAVGIITFNDMALTNAVDIGATSLMKAGTASNSNMSVASDYSTGVAPLTDPCQYAFGLMTSATSNLLPQNITVTYYLTYVDLSTTPGTTVNVTIGPFTGTAANSCTSYSADFAIGGSLTMVASYPCTLGLYGFNVPGCKIAAKASQFIYTS
jgi:Flp pilus assembly protein TadG